jgi:hypothetical protein
MKVIRCDICGREIKSDNPVTSIWNKNVFIDMDSNPIEDVCEECFKIIHCCINMMKETKWKSDFHEVLESGSIWDRERAGYKLSDLENATKLKF